MCHEFARIRYQIGAAFQKGMGMAIQSFDQRLDRLEWTPTAQPTQEIVDRVLGGAKQRRVAPRNVGATLLGAICGILIGFALLGMQMPGSLWGPDTGLSGLIIGTAAFAALIFAVVLACVAAYFGRARPALMQFASMQLLMIVVLLLA